MSDETKPAKSPKSKTPKAAAPVKPDFTGPDTFDLHSLHDLMRAVKPHAGVGIAAGAVSFIAALSTSSADSAAIILDLICIERSSPISFIFSNLMENKNIILL